MQRTAMRRPGVIRAVTFDVGGTLIEPWPSVGEVYAEVAAQFGLTGVAPEALNRQFARAWNAQEHFDYSRAAWRELVRRTFAGLSPEAPSDACFDAIYQRFGSARAWRLFDDVLPTLAALKSRGLKLGLISNWDERLRPLLDHWRLSPCFDALTISHEAGSTKPAPEMFLRTATRLGLAPGSILHVGNSVAQDVAGAEAAGMRALLLDRSAAAGAAGRISSLRQLQAVLDEGRGDQPAD